MNREILFRGYQRELKKWVYGSLIKLPNGSCFIFDYQNNFEDRIEVSPDSVGQYIDRLDINGNRIFEGDISSEKSLVVWFNDLCYDSGGASHSGFFLKSKWDKDNNPELSYYISFDKVRVIGNIYENPDIV